jgi:Flp pilus assembly protein TadG
MMNWKSLLPKRRLGDESGASAAEFALVAPIFVLFLTGSVDFGAMAWTQMQVAAAARAGASYALSKGFDSTQISNAVTSATHLAVTVSPTPAQVYGCPDASSGVTTSGVTSTTVCSSGMTAGKYVTVGATANYAAPFSLPFLADSVTLSSTASVRIP